MAMTTLADPARPRTSLGRITGGVLASNLGFAVALLTPLQLLLAQRISVLDPDHVETSFGLVTAAGALLAMVFNPIAGRISDRTAARFGPRRTWIVAGASAGALALAGIAATTAVWQVLVLWCAVQLLFNFQFAASNALLPDQVPEDRRSSISGLVGMAMCLGPMIGIGLVNVVPTEGLGWVAVAAVAAALAWLCAALVRDPAIRVEREPRTGFSLARTVRSYWISPRRHPAFGWAWATRFLIMCGYAAGSYNAIFLSDRLDVPIADVGGRVLVMSSVSTVLLALASVTFGFLSDRLRKQKPFVIGAGIAAAVALVLQAFAPSFALILVAGAVLGLGTGAFLAVDLALCTRVLPSSADAGKDLAIINIANTLPQSLVPLVAPALLALGGFPALYLTLAAIALCGAFAVRPIPELGETLPDADVAFPLAATAPTGGAPA